MCDVAMGRFGGVICAHAVGSDFDDSAAIAVALSDPELDVKLIVRATSPNFTSFKACLRDSWLQVTATGDTIARAQVVAKYLTLFGRTDIPIGVGVANDNKTYTPLYAWAADTNLTSCVLLHYVCLCCED